MLKLETAMKHTLTLITLIVAGCTELQTGTNLELSSVDSTALTTQIALQKIDQISVPQDAEFRCPIQMRMLAEPAQGWTGLVFQFGKGNLPLKSAGAIIDPMTNTLGCHYNDIQNHTVQGLYAMPHPVGVSCKAKGSRSSGFLFDCKLPGLSQN